MEEGEDIECVTEMMRLFSDAQQWRVNVVTCTLAFRHKAKSQEGVMNFHLSHMPAIPFLWIATVCLLTIQFPVTLTPGVQSSSLIEW